MSSVPAVANGTAKPSASAATPFSNGPGGNLKAAKIIEPPKHTLHVDQIATYVFYGFLVWLMMLVKLASPSIWSLLWYFLWGAAAGAGGTYVYFSNVKRKQETNEVLSFDPGLKGLKFMCGELPSWLSLTEREKVNWLNNMLTELWPFYDKAVCDMVKTTVEPMMDQMKPPGVIKSIGFKNLTFGTAPFRIEDMLVVEAHDDEVLLEVNIRWAGDANITMAVEMPAGGDLTRMCPKITDMSFMGTARIALRPLIDEIPCFGCVMVSFRKPPLIKYKLDFGKALGGSTAANAIKGFIEPFIEDYLIGYFVWPKRLVVPIVYNENTQREMEKLQLRDVGIMRVKLTEAKNLKAYDMNGKSDPTVTLWIDPLHKRNSKTAKSTLTPHYGDEEFFLLVQEPKDQFLRLEMFDVDFFNAEKLASSWKVWQGVSKAFNAKTHMGRSMINIKHICAREGEEKAAWYPLGKGEWGDDDGPGKGEGEIFLKCCYRSFASFSSISNLGTKGVLVVQVFDVSKIEMSKGQTSLTAHLVFKCSGQHEYKSNPATGWAIKDAAATASGTVTSTPSGSGSSGLPKSLSILRGKPSIEYCTPVFTDAKHTFYDVDMALAATVVVKMKVMTAGGALGTDEELGRYEISGPDIYSARFQNQQGRINKTVYLKDCSCAETKMHFEITFIPYF